MSATEKIVCKSILFSAIPKPQKTVSVINFLSLSEELEQFNWKANIILPVLHAETGAG